jgi:hypothetical protein
MVWQAEAEDIVLPATDGREIRLRRVTEPDLGIVVRRFDVRWEKLQLLCFAVVVEYLDGLQPASLCRRIQFPQITECLLARTVRSTYGLHQRPVGVVLAVLNAPVRPQKHSAVMLSRTARSNKTVGLHYIRFQKTALGTSITCMLAAAQNCRNRGSRDELGLEAVAGIQLPLARSLGCRGRIAARSVQHIGMNAGTQNRELREAASA